MKKKFVGWIVRKVKRWLAWVDQADYIKLQIPKDETFERTLQFVRKAELLKDVSGEYKRHQVYAKLRKEFLEKSGNELGLLIEAVIMENL